jgi:hypothetical protein
MPLTTSEAALRRSRRGPARPPPSLTAWAACGRPGAAAHASHAPHAALSSASDAATALLRDTWAAALWHMDGVVRAARYLLSPRGGHLPN